MEMTHASANKNDVFGRNKIQIFETIVLNDELISKVCIGVSGENVILKNIITITIMHKSKMFDYDYNNMTSYRNNKTSENNFS